ncbi:MULTISPECIES: hypothetical protein [Bacillaceae]|uniref:Uncharacterized protein n=1 Tax=Evansella alkalicola TaxID=745819 RepID=A0ABS6K1M0_9BACI|nr:MULTISPECIES: hypothetical protein [Bacillaceae]MBU9724342.1 hypothetical protein [Bacillus alkalicola]
MSAEAEAADKMQTNQAVNVRRSKSSGQKTIDPRSKCPQKQEQRTKGKRIKQ